jgi:hypothetical protein
MATKTPASPSWPSRRYKRERPAEASLFPLRRKPYELAEIDYVVESDLKADMPVTERELNAIENLLGPDLVVFLKRLD